MSTFDPLHSLLRRQLKKYFGGADRLPPEWNSFLRAVSDAYKQADVDRGMVEHSLELVSQELMSANASMRAAYRRLFYSSPDGIFVFNRDFVCTEWNPGMTFFTGIAEPDARGQPIMNMLRSLDYDDAASLLEVLMDMTVIVEERVYHLPHGGTGYFSGHLSPLRDESGQVIGGLGVLRDVTESRRVAHELQEHLRESIVLNRVFAVTSTTLNVTEALQKIIAEIANALDVPQSGIGILNQAQDRLTIVADYQPEGKSTVVGLVLPVENNIATQYVLNERKPLAIGDALNDQRLGVVRDVMLARGVASMLLVPLIVRDRVLGTVGFDSYVAREFTPQEIQLVQNVATAMGQALDNAQLFTDLAQERAYLLLANDVGRALSAEVSIQGVLNTALGLAPRLGAEYGYALVLENGEPILFKSNFPRVAAWSHEQNIAYARRLLELGLERWLLETRQPAVVFDTRTDARWHRAPETRDHEPARSVIAVPFFGTRSALSGVLGFHHAAPDKFDERLVSVTELIGRDLANALENARLFEKIQAALSDRQRAENERLAVERKMLEAQKLESLGVLAGGIAHDFNNLLVGLLGNAGLALLELPQGSRARQYVEQMQLGAQRAADLTRQMLAYSGKGRFIVQPVHLNEIIQEMVKLLRVSISKQAAFQLNLATALPLISADATQLRQVIMNLITNASDALGSRSGTITVSTGAAPVERAELQRAQPFEDLPAGEYVFVQVADTGVGMDEETQARIFEPFYTTKFTGRGLGLAAVQGIMRGHHGAVQCTSAPGQGTTFRLLFPPLSQPVTPIQAAPEPADAFRGKILIVDDEAGVRQITVEVLNYFGYECQAAENGTRAIELVTMASTPFDCVLLDLTMPGISSEETLRILRQIDPALAVVLMTGYSEQDAAQRFANVALNGFLQKPFTPQDLHRQLQAALAHAHGDTRARA